MVILCPDLPEGRQLSFKSAVRSAASVKRNGVILDDVVREVTSGADSMKPGILNITQSGWNISRRR